MEVEQKINKIISDVLCVDIESVKHESDLRKNLGADELDIVEIVMSLEEEFGKCITEDECDKLSKVKDCIDLINTKLEN